MSSRDYTEHHLELPSLVGRPCFLSLATNSVKLHIDENKEDGTYLWIDPPWQFGRHGEVIESSDSCPFHEDADYNRKFAEWCSRFEPAFDTRIESIEALPDGSLWISLALDYAFFVPAEFFPEDPPLWYDHWYFRKEPQPNCMDLRAALQKLFARRLFSRPAEPAGCRDIIQWWEWRRIPYNLAVGAAGIVTLSVVIGVAAIASEKFDEPLGLPDPPILAVVAVIAYGLGANLCFTGGWIVEILARWLWPERVGAFAPMAFALGLALSVLLTLAPAFLFTGALLLRLAFA